MKFTTCQAWASGSAHSPLRPAQPHSRDCAYAALSERAPRATVTRAQSHSHCPTGQCGSHHNGQETSSLRTMPRPQSEPDPRPGLAFGLHASPRGLPSRPSPALNPPQLRFAGPPASTHVRLPGGRPSPFHTTGLLAPGSGNDEPGLGTGLRLGQLERILQLPWNPGERGTPFPHLTVLQGQLSLQPLRSRLLGYASSIIPFCYKAPVSSTHTVPVEIPSMCTENQGPRIPPHPPPVKSLALDQGAHRGPAREPLSFRTAASSGRPGRQQGGNARSLPLPITFPRHRSYRHPPCCPLSHCFTIFTYAYGQERLCTRQMVAPPGPWGWGARRTPRPPPGTLLRGS